MNSELEVLKKIFENNGEISVRRLSNKTGLSPDYLRYLCNSLLKKSEIKLVKRDYYKISAKGEKLLGKIKKILLKEEGIKKIVLPWPKKLLKILKMKLPKREKIPVEEKKLKLGKEVEKSIVFLKTPKISRKKKHVKK